MWSKKFLLRRNIIIWFQASFSASLCTTIFILQLWSTSTIILQAVLTHIFWLRKKFPVLWNPGSKDSTSHAFNFCSYSINSLANYLFLFNLANFPISRHLLFVIWYSDSKTTEYRILLVFFPKSSFRICNNEILFFVLACYCLQLITQK